MGTNFYFKIKADFNLDMSIQGEIRKSIIEKMKYTLDEVTEIHIGKRSLGWYPLFEKTKYYSSVDDIINFYNENKNDVIIIDEYYNEYTLEALDDELFGWNRTNSGAKSHLDFGRQYYKDNAGYEFVDNQFS